MVDASTQIYDDCLQELEENKEELLGYGDLSDGCSSDSCASEDNLDENDLVQILPIKRKSKPHKDKNIKKKEPVQKP